MIENRDTNHQDLYSGLIRLHILHHACEGDIFGLGMIEELGRHGYKLSSGTMYPLLHSLEKRVSIPDDRVKGPDSAAFTTAAGDESCFMSPLTGIRSPTVVIR
ncbi:MAG: helix-turn-helix transcriptional regulator [Candidatus Sulfotelmatobacter sp.]